MQVPLVSICIPAYGQPAYLARTLNALQQQSFSDFEIILSDDSPNDEVQKLLESYTFTQPVFYVKNEKPLGSPANWNKAVSYARGKYLKILHHDDWFPSPESLADGVSLLEENPQADLAFSATAVFDEKKQSTWIYRRSEKLHAEVSRNPSRLIRGNSIGAPSVVLLRRKAWQAFDENLRWLVDIEWYIRLLRKNPHLAYTPEPLITTLHNAPGTVTLETQGNREVEIGETLYLYHKLIRKGHGLYLWELLGHFGIKNAAQIRASGYREKFPLAVRTYLFAAGISLPFARWLTRMGVRIRWRLYDKKLN